MGVGLRSAAGILAAVAMLAAASARTAAVEPAVHQFVKGEHFRYSSVVTLSSSGSGDNVIAADAPKTMRFEGDYEVVTAAPSGVFAERLSFDDATLAQASAIVINPTGDPNIIHADADGTWRYEGGHPADNVVTWDASKFGAQPRNLVVGQQWTFDVPASPRISASHAVVRVVSADDSTFALHVDAALQPWADGPMRTTSTWTADARFDAGIVTEFHSASVVHMTSDAGAGAVDSRIDRVTRLVEHTVPSSRPSS